MYTLVSIKTKHNTNLHKSYTMSFSQVYNTVNNAKCLQQMFIYVDVYMLVYM